MAGVEAGEWVTCPSCGDRVLGKSMIPVLGPGGSGVSYLCVTCARAAIVRPDGSARAEADGSAGDPDPLTAG
jgi:DNA-directed RNA polymerase subunit RPC12/RpoP